ncbi:MAG: hypothetical protein NVS4B12_27530 [Ktedonobacteraceae bacterium]
MGEIFALKAVIADTILAFAINSGYVIVGAAFMVVIITIIVAVVLLRRSSKKKATSGWQQQSQQVGTSADSRWNAGGIGQGQGDRGIPQQQGGWGMPQQQQQVWGTQDNAQQGWGASQQQQAAYPSEAINQDTLKADLPPSWGAAPAQSANAWDASQPAAASQWHQNQDADQRNNSPTPGTQNQSPSWQQPGGFGPSMGNVPILRAAGTQPKNLNHEHLQFTAFHPKVMPAGEWRSLLVYAYIETALAAIQADAVKFRDELAPVIGEVDARASYPLTRGTQITIVPTFQEVTFNPERVTFTWIEDWHQVKFRFQVDRKLEGATHNGEITIYAGPLMIASLKISLWIVEPHSPLSTKDNSDIAEVTAYIYKQIFTSYSHTDSTIVFVCRNIYKALGFDTLIDVDNLRAGQSWNAALMRMIDSCDIFQLFWSSNAAQSRYVRQEWQYALQHNKGEGFIRPVYWEKPLVPPPSELSHLHFGYIELPKIETSFENRESTVRHGMVRVESGKESGHIYVVRKDSLSIGRSRERDIFLEDLAVSRLHATIINMGVEKYVLRDEGSANGTKVNGQMVNKYQSLPLIEGDKIQVG